MTFGVSVCELFQLARKFIGGRRICRKKICQLLLGRLRLTDLDEGAQLIHVLIHLLLGDINVVRTPRHDRSHTEQGWFRRLEQVYGVGHACKHTCAPRRRKVRLSAKRCPDTLGDEVFKVATDLIRLPRHRGRARQWLS